MKISLEDADIDRIATAVAAKVGGKPGATKPKPKPPADEVEDETGGETEGEDTGGEDAEADFEGEAEGEDEGEAETGKAPTKDDVLESLKAVTAKFSQEDAMSVMKASGGMSKLSEVPKAKYAAVIAACNKKLATKKKK